jgi:membrane-bound lytic murein transglycosylase B
MKLKPNTIALFSAMKRKPAAIALYFALMAATIVLFFVLIPRIDQATLPSAQEPTQELAQQTSQEEDQGESLEEIEEESPEETQEEIQEPYNLIPFSENPDVTKFIARMAALHRFDKKVLASRFAAITPNRKVLDMFNPLLASEFPDPEPPKPVAKPPKKKSLIPLKELRIRAGLQFWLEHAEILQTVYEQYEVPPEIIVAIIGVETWYGKNTGDFGVMEALATLGFYSPRRGDFFRDELEHFLVLARENKLNPLKVKGSYAGAIGIPQFMPGNWRKYAVAYEEKNTIDLINNIADSISSVGNYLKTFGWQKDMPVAHRVTIRGKPKKSWLEAGMLPSLYVKELAAQGVSVPQNSLEIATLIELPIPGKPAEYWLGYQNYYTITRYNKDTSYSMSVFMLAEDLRGRIDAESLRERIEEERLRKIMNVENLSEPIGTEENDKMLASTAPVTAGGIQ